MFLDRYKPRSEKIIKKINYYPLLFLIAFIIFSIVFLSVLFFMPSKKIDYSNTFDGKIIKTKNLIKIDNAKLAGIDNMNRFFTITASSATQTQENKNIFFLYNVKADISSQTGNWSILNTKEAKYDIVKKLLISDTEVELFYDDGSSMVLSSMLYNLKSGILKSEDGIILFGQWGNFKADNFIYDTNTETFKFYKNPIMMIN